MLGVVNCVAYADGKRVAVPELKDVSQIFEKQDGFVWIGLHEPNEDILRQIQQIFHLHDLAIEDAHQAHQRPKIERYGDGVFIVLRTVQRQHESREIQLGETHLFVGPTYIVTVRHRSLISYTQVRTHCEATPHLLRLGPGYVLYALMDFIVDQYFPVVELLEDELEGLEEAIFSTDITRETTERIYRLKSNLLQVKRAVSPLVDVCNQLMHFEPGLIPDVTRTYFRDVYDHVIRLNEMVDITRELLTSALESHLSLITVAQNEVMKKLGAWMAIAAVPTLIAGMYGMNFDYMPGLKSVFGYPLTTVTMLLICGFLYSRFKRSGWL